MWMPVCGSDGITYPTESCLEHTKCKEKPDLTVAYVGECKKQGQLIFDSSLAVNNSSKKFVLPKSLISTTQFIHLSELGKVK